MPTLVGLSINAPHPVVRLTRRPCRTPRSAKTPRSVKLIIVEAGGLRTDWQGAYRSPAAELIRPVRREKSVPRPRRDRRAALRDLALALVDHEQNQGGGKAARRYPDRVQSPLPGGNSPDDGAGGKRSDQGGVYAECPSRSTVILDESAIPGFDEAHEIAGGGEGHVHEVTDAPEQADLHAAQERDRHRDETGRHRCRQESEPGKDGRLDAHRPSQRMCQHLFDAPGFDVSRHCDARDECEDRPQSGKRIGPTLLEEIDSEKDHV